MEEKKFYTINQRREYRVLKAVGLKELPQPYDGRGTWTLALIKVVKSDMSQSYVLAQNKMEDDPIVRKDFGSVAAIVRYGEIYPLQWMPFDRFVVVDDKTQLVNFVKKAIVDMPEDVQKQVRAMKRSELRRFAQNILIDRYIAETDILRTFKLKQYKYLLK